jgi:hypothetical protein
VGVPVAARVAYRVGQQGSGVEVHLVAMALDETDLSTTPVAQCSRRPATIWVELLSGPTYRLRFEHPVVKALLGMVTCARCRGFIREEEQQAQSRRPPQPKREVTP